MKTHRAQKFSIMFAMAALCIAAAFAQEFGPGSYDLTWNTIDGGGGTSIGGSFELSGTIGQPDASSVAMTGNGYELTGGFWPGLGPAPVDTCPPDIAPPNGDGIVNVSDLLAVINAWGPCPAPPASCPADFVPPGGNGVVNVSELLGVINAWGLCP